jgi:hypothetical protein
LPDADVTLVVGAPAAYVEAPPLTVRAGVSNVTVTLERGVSVAGIVRADDGATISAQVTARWTRDGDERERSTYTTDGRFRLQGIPPGVTLTLEARASEDDVELPPVTLSGVRAGARDVVLEVAMGFRVEGTIVDENGRPLRDAWIEHQDGEYVSPTDAGGRFRFRFPDRTARHLFASKDGVDAPPVEVVPPATELVIRLARGETISGTVVGKDVAGFDVTAVWASRPDSEHAPRAQTETDGEGSLLIGPFAGPVRLVARRDGDPRYAVSPPLEPGARDVRLVLRDGLSIEGVLLDAEGKPTSGGVAIKGDLVAAYERSDESGRFSVTGLPPGTYRVGPHVWGGPPAVPVEAGTTDVVVRER